MAATLCIATYRHDHDDLLSIRKGKKNDRSYFEHFMVAGSGWAAVSISETVDLLGFSHTTLGFTENEE